MTPSEPRVTAAFERLIDEVVQRRLEARLHDLFERAAEEIYARSRQLSEIPYSPRFSNAHADEIREPTASADRLATELSHALANVFERATRTVDPVVLVDSGAEIAERTPDLPTHLMELEERSLSTTETAERLGVNSSRIRQRLLAGTLYGFKPGASWRIPEFQFEGDRLVPGIESVFPEIRSSTSPVAVARWFVLPWADLVVDEERETVVSPKAWLLEGRDPAPVIAQARVL